MKAVLRFLDSFIRERGQVIERLKRRENLGRFIVAALATYIVLTAVYGLVMGGFRWAHPKFFYSDFVIEGDGASITGMVDTMDPETSTVTTRSIKLAPEKLVGRPVRFNRTDPTPPYTITGAQRHGPYCTLTVDGPPMVAEKPWKFTLLAAVKVPALFLVTLLVCLPALYVLNIAMGWRLRFGPTAALLVFAVAGTSVMLAVLAPIALLFTILTDHYHFMMVLHVLIFIAAGAYGVQTLAVGLNGLREDSDARPGRGRLILAWLLLYMFVGSQVTWSLRPWVGTPYIAEFAAFRPASTNFYVNMIGALGVRSVGKLGDVR